MQMELSRAIFIFSWLAGGIYKKSGELDDNKLFRT